MKQTILVGFLALACAVGCSSSVRSGADAAAQAAAEQAAAAKADAAALARAKAVLAQMTLEEKVSILSGSGTMFLNAVPRVGINREWTFSDNSNSIRADMTRFDWIYGHKDPKQDSSTVLPLCSALASTWNRDLAAAHGDVLGAEMLVRGKDQLLGPGVNIMRTPLCGRNWEYWTEDPCLGAKLVVPMLKALQSHGVAATIKHYACNNQEWERSGVDTDVDERTLREIYLPVFRAAVQEAGVLSVMCSYNRFRGTWLSENAYLQKEILRNEWGFKGTLVTDWGAQHSTVAAALGGTDIECNQGYGIRYYQNPWLCWQKFGKVLPREHSTPETQPLVFAVKDGKVPAATVDEMATHVLYVMAKCGFLDQPAARVTGPCNPPEHQAKARAIGEEAIVLLKNDAGVLPLDAAKMKTVVVIGNLVDAHHTVGGWSAEGNPPYEITPYQALQERLGKGVKIVRAPLVASDGNAAVHDVAEKYICTFDTTAKDTGMSIRAWQLAYWPSREQAGEPVAHAFMPDLKADWKANDPAPGCKAGHFAACWTTKLLAPETGSFVLATKSDQNSGTRIRVNGKTVVDNWDGKNYILAAGKADFEKGKQYDVEVDYHPGDSESTCTFGWLLPSERGMSRDEVRAVASKADAVLVFTGTSVGHGRALECEGGDRPNLLLPVGHDEAIAEILSWKLPNTVVINHSGSPVEMPWLAQCATLVQHPYLGQEGGRPLAAVLFGDVNPSGRLPCTWPKSLADTPVAQMGTYNAKHVTYNEGFYVGYRWYDHKSIEPMFPFGYGLSYTTFKFAPVKLSTKKLAKDGEVVASVAVSNTGARAGKEVVQLYVSAVNPKVERCVRELKDFAKVSVPAGATVTAVLRVTPRDLAYYDVATKKFRADAGEYEVSIGASERDIRSAARIVLPEAWTE